MYQITWHHIQEGSQHHSSVLEMFQLAVNAVNEQNERFKSGFEHEMVVNFVVLLFINMSIYYFLYLF
jgi:hypothetical protein